MFYLPESPRYYVMKDSIKQSWKTSFVEVMSIAGPVLLEELVEVG